MKRHIYFIFVSILCSAEGISYEDRLNFINDFITRNGRPASIVSFLKLSQSEKIKYSREFTNTNKCAAFHSRFVDTTHDVYLADLDQEYTTEILKQAADRGILKSPTRWLLFYSTESQKRHSDANNTSNDLISYDGQEITDDGKFYDIAAKLNSVYTAINTEVYIAWEREHIIQLYLVYKIREKMPLIWDEDGVWNKQTGFDRAPSEVVISMRRLNLRRLNMTTVAVVLDNRTTDDIIHYRNSHTDITSKCTYHMTKHLFDWLNVNGTINTTATYGYVQADGKFDGMVRELAEGRSEFCAGVLFMLESRTEFVHFIFPPTRLEISFLFRKPPLATIANIYSLPFSRGVWISVVLLLVISTLALYITSLWEMLILKKPRLQMTIAQRVSQHFHDTLCLMFQQGIYIEFYSSSARQVVLLGLMSFMFLYTAYSANVFVLLQSTTNEINSLVTLMKSPLQCGAEDFTYNRLFFSNDNRSMYRAFWLKKGAPQGEAFFLSSEEGIRRVREGFYAFHAEISSAYYHIQKTYLEHEKCNLAEIRYFSFSDPYICTSKKTTSKEQLRIGMIRIVESGLQSRTNRRLVSRRPKCAEMAMFTPVSLLYVTPIFKYLIFIYCTSVFILGLEIYVQRREKQKKISLKDSGGDDPQEDITALTFID